MTFVKSAIQVTLIAAGLSVIPVVFSADVVTSLHPQQQGQVSFVSGGVGEEEAQAIKKLALDYPLELLFVTKGTPNQYLADVKVTVKDKGGNVVLDTVSLGPYLLAKMPSGNYSISAESQGTVKRQAVQITGGKAQRVVFVWDQ